MTYTVSSGTLNSTIPYHTIPVVIVGYKMLLNASVGTGICCNCVIVVCILTHAICYFVSFLLVYDSWLSSGIYHIMAFLGKIANSLADKVKRAAGVVPPYEVIEAPVLQFAKFVAFTYCLCPLSVNSGKHSAFWWSKISH